MLTDARPPDPPSSPPLRIATQDEREPYAVDIRGAAQMLTCSKKQIRNLIKRKELRYFTCGRGYRIRVEEIKSYVTRQEKRKTRGIDMPDRGDGGKFLPGEVTPLFDRQKGG